MKSLQRIVSTPLGRFNAPTVAMLLVAVIYIVQPAWGRSSISTGSVPTGTSGGALPATRIATMPAEPISSDNGISYAGDHSSQVISGGGGGFDTIINPGATLSSPAYADALAAFNRAAAAWEARISDPISVNINADMASLPSGVLGSTSSVLLQDDFDTVRGLMVSDAADEADDALVAHLPTYSQFSALVPDVTEGAFALDGKMVGTKANFKAMGYTGLDEAFGASDAAITFSTNFSFDYDNSDGVTPGTWDFETIAVHEIGHALGFVSRLDYVDVLLNDLEATFPEGVDTVEIGIGTLDMFGFADDEPGWDPSNTTEFTSFPRLLTPGIDRVTDQLSDLYDSDAEMLMSEGRFNGDGRQASHWKDNSLTSVLVGVMDPTFASQQVIPIEDSDLRALDLIGYEITVPEPATMLLLGLGGTGLLLRRRRRLAA